MGKGKKKGGGKATTGSVEASLSSLSIADSGASTLQAVEEEESVGLTGGSSRKKKPQKAVAKPEPIEEKKDDKPQEEAPKEEEEESFGLTGGARKKPQKATAKPEPFEEKKDDIPSVSTTAPPKAEPPQEEEETVGLGLTGGAKKSRNRKKKSAQAAQPGAQSGQPTAQSSQPPSQAVQPGPQPGQPQIPGFGRGQPQMPGFAGPPQEQPSASGPAFPGAPPPGWGRGRGVPMAAPSQRPGTALQATATVQPSPVAGASMPAGQSGDQIVKYEPLPKSRNEASALYAIPAKILGRTVPSKPVRVITNYLPMVIKPVKVNRYDVGFAPDRPRKMFPAVYKLIKDKYFPNEVVAFDTVKNAYCMNPLKADILNHGHEVDFYDPNGRIMRFTVTIKHTGVLDFSRMIRHMETQGSSLSFPQEEVQCIDVILRQGTLEQYVKSGRNYFKRPQNPLDLSGGLEMWTGLFQSAIFTGRPYVNVDVAHKGFPKHQSMLDAWKSMGLDIGRGIEQQPGRNAETFKDFVKGLKVVCSLVGGASNGQHRDFTVITVRDRPTALTFCKEKDGGKKMTVYDYYLKEKGYKIKYPHLPCLWVGARDKSIYYPIELCEVGYGQPLKKQLNEFQLATMVREAATPPDERKRKIEEVARSMNYSQNAVFRKFGLEISNQFLEVEAKVLQPPVLNCGEGKPTYPSRGAWNSQKLLKPEALVSWGFIGVELQPQACNYELISSLLTQIGTQLGMQVAKPKITVFNVTITELRALFFKALDQEVRFLFIIVPFRGKDYYHKVKQFAENDVGILTQCIKEQTATRRMNPQTIKNILLKVNSKLMGINQCLANSSMPRCITTGGVMIVGADVTHPSPDQQNVPSIAAVTASMDPKCFIYHIELSIQSPKEEVIRQFEEIMYDHLKLYKERNGFLPKKIYIFRDGVSEGQFKQVLNSELSGLYTAYSRFSKDKPEALFLLVQKRHHTRVFGADSRTKKIINVEPGTVVDTHIVHPKELDFYLVSHTAIKGTARPTRYHSVCNDGGIPHDEVEQLTYYLCHLYSRCMRAVSYPTPTYYAHLACLRARSLTHGVTFDNNELYRAPKRLRVLDKMLRSSIMFFV